MYILALERFAGKKLFWNWTSFMNVWLVFLTNPFVFLIFCRWLIMASVWICSSSSDNQDSGGFQKKTSKKISTTNWTLFLLLSWYFLRKINPFLRRLKILVSVPALFFGGQNKNSISLITCKKKYKTIIIVPNCREVLF